MRKFALMLAVALTGAGLAVVGPSPVDAGGPTSDVYVVHGLNLDGQGNQNDGGTNVTVCTGDSELVGNLQFGEVASLGAIAADAAVPVQVYLQPTPGTPVDCAAPGGATKAIDQTVNLPAVPVALVATAGPESQGPELLLFDPIVECVGPDMGRVEVGHTANAGTVDLLIDGDVVAPLVYGDWYGLDSTTPVSVQVNLGGNPVVGPVNVPVEEGVNRVIFVVGNQPDDPATPVVPLFWDIPIPVCDWPEPQPEPEPAAPRAGVVAARPTFTG